MRISTKTYHTLRYWTQIILPAIGGFIITVCGAWGIDIGDAIGTTISAVVTLLSGVLGASSAIYDKEKGDEKNGRNTESNIASDLHRYVHVSRMAGAERDQNEERQ